MMHPTFTGSSRKPRQVNLSGRATNPFAAVSSPNGGPQQAVVSAHQDRAKRQHQRAQQEASRRIQRVWRGHSSRQRAFKAWREQWDAQEQSAAEHQAYRSPEDSLAALQRLLLFCSPKEESDAKRLVWYGNRQIQTQQEGVTGTNGPWPAAYLRLQHSCLAALGRKEMDQSLERSLLKILSFSVANAADQDTASWISYYQVLSKVKEPPQNALLAPLKSKSAYAGFAASFLTRPQSLASFDEIRQSIDLQALTQALVVYREPSGSVRSRLWLLGNFICLSQRPNTTVVARLLASLADDVDFQSSPMDLDNVSFDRDVLAKIDTGLPLNAFLHRQITSLINQDSIRNLLRRTDQGASDANALAGYALTLLRCFLWRADDIRMWLYLGPNDGSRDDDGQPATLYFWDAAQRTSIFQTIAKDSRTAVNLLKAQQQSGEWRTILMFLELYTFLLKLMDDEEFMSAGGTSGRRNSAIPISDVQSLVTFLKNLGFTMYWNSQEITQSADVSARDASSFNLSRHFGSPQNSTVVKAQAEIQPPPQLVGITGMSLDYLKDLVTGLLRAIYERDSRRKFLPRDHWLMTTRFDMSSFIPGVVAEEENRHMIQNQEDDDRDEDDDDHLLSESRFSSSRIGPNNAFRSQQQRERKQRQASRKRYLEAVAPRLEILQNMPFFIPFETRVEVFRQFVHLDQEKRRNGYVDPDLWRQSVMFAPNNHSPRDLQRHHAKVRRKHEFDDAFEQFYPLGADLKEPIQITFVDEFDIVEAGIDGGGVTKEFLTSVTGSAFDPEVGFFSENEQHLLYPNPTSVESHRDMMRQAGYSDSDPEHRAHIRDLLQRYEFLGRIIGKCLYEGILVDVSFAGFFLIKWALFGGDGSVRNETSYRATINDLKDLDEGLYKGLLTVKNYPGDVEDLGLTFVVNDVIGLPGAVQKTIERELMPGGANMPVTNDNRLIYITQMARYRLQAQSAQQTFAFLRGLSSIIQPTWLSMFNQSELQTLIGGAASQIDVADLRRNTLYGGVYVIGDDNQEHPSVKLFWDVMQALPDEERRKVLKFVTSTPRGPLLGFSALNPRFSIRDNGDDERRFPTTSTCVNLLKLPRYRDERTLREKLLYAVNSGAGFDLS